MKILVLTICIFLSHSLISSALAAEILSPAQQTTVLNRLDDSSSDNIDEGDCLVSYDQIHCDDLSDQCKVSYREHCFNVTTNKMDPWTPTKVCTIPIGNARSPDTIADIAFQRFFDAECDL